MRRDNGDRSGARSTPAWTQAGRSASLTAADNRIRRLQRCAFSSSAVAVPGAPHGSPRTVTLRQRRQYDHRVVSLTSRQQRNRGRHSPPRQRQPGSHHRRRAAWTTASTPSIYLDCHRRPDPTPANNCTVRNNGTAGRGAPRASRSASTLVNGVQRDNHDLPRRTGNSSVSSTVTIAATTPTRVTIGATPAWTTAARQSISWTVTNDQDRLRQQLHGDQQRHQLPGAPHASPLSVTLVNSVNAITVTCLDEPATPASRQRSRSAATPNPVVTISSPNDGTTLPAARRRRASHRASLTTRPTPISNCTVALSTEPTLPARRTA